MKGGCALVVGLGEALGVEGLGVRPVARGVVRAVDVDDHGRACGDGDVADAVVGDGLAVDHPEGRIEAERLHDDLRGVLEPGDVGVVEGRRPRTASNSWRTLSRHRDAS